MSPLCKFRACDGLHRRRRFGHGDRLGAIGQGSHFEETYGFHRDTPSLDLPIIIVQGALEAPGRDDLAREWFDALQVPDKQLIVLGEVAHNPSYQAPDAFRDVRRQLIADTGGGG